MNYKLGKLPVRRDTRTLKFSTILKAGVLPAIPTTYDVDSQFPTLVDNNMYLNDKLGDCVIAARAHMTLRFECFEQKCQIPISDNDVRTEYFKETGGSDSGLNMLDSLNQWRQNGWMAGGKLYTIDAFASVDWTNHNEVMAGCYLFNGIYFGMQVPNSAIAQTKSGQPWTIVPDDGGNAGGHGVYKKGFITIQNLNVIGPICVTWGKPQQMTWDFWDKYIDEAYIVIDQIDSWMNPATDPLNLPLLKEYLAALGAMPSTKITVSSLKLPAGTVGKPYSAALAAAGGTLPYTWAIQSGKLPAGLNFAPSGQITGVPTAAGRSGNITFICTDADGNATGIILTIQIKGKCIFS